MCVYIYMTSIYMHGTRCSSRCSGMQAICAQLIGGFIFLIYICSVALLKASMIN